MGTVKQEFNPRQVMSRPNFELFHFSDNKPLSVDYHNHDFYEIYYFISGKVNCVIEGRNYYLKPGDILLIGNNEVHRPLIELGKTYERIVVWVHPNYVRNIEQGEINLTACFEDSARRHNNLLRPSNEMFRMIRKIYERLEAVYGSSAYGSAALSRAYITELLVLLNKAYFDMAEDDMAEVEYNEKISDIIRYINDHLCGDLSLDTLAGEFYISKYHLSRQFKDCVGFTLHQYVLKKRLMNARTLLQEGGTVNGAFIRSGFNDYSNFSRSFKEEFGCSPKQYLRMVQSNPLT
ncbi:MAG: AraC family transcriptional regulator [Oscillospiraceae bacterium]|nr:AraC family transcriptional regulator [Oscillospiraceae bacterium]